MPKDKRLKGMTYVNKKGQTKEGKALGPRCTSAFCRKSTLRECEAIGEEQRKLIFQKFWSMKSWSERRLFVQTLVVKVKHFYLHKIAI